MFEFNFKKFVSGDADPKHLAEEDHDSLMRAQVHFQAEMDAFIASLKANVEEPMYGGFGSPNLTRNGNFLNQDGAAEAPGFIPNGWDTPFVATGMVFSYAVPPVVAGQPVVPGNLVQFQVVAGPGNVRWFNQRLQVSNRKTYSLSLYYKTESAVEGAHLVFSNTAGSTCLRSVDLPPTGGLLNYYPSLLIAEPLTISVEEGDTSPYLNIQLGSVSGPTVSQTLSFAAVAVSEGTRPVLWKPSAMDQQVCQGDY